MHHRAKSRNFLSSSPALFPSRPCTYPREEGTDAISDAHVSIWFFTFLGGMDARQHFTCQPLVPIWRVRKCAAVRQSETWKASTCQKQKQKNWIENLVVNCHSICRASSLSLHYIIIISTLFDPKSRVCAASKNVHMWAIAFLSHISWVRHRDTENKMKHFFFHNKIVVAVASIPHFYLNFVRSTCKVDLFYPFFRWLCEIKNKTKTNFRWTSNI